MAPYVINSCGWDGDAYLHPVGMGDTAGDVQLAQLVGSGAQLGTGAALSAAAAAGSSATVLGMSLSVAIPVVGAALAGISLLATYLIKNSGCGPTCIETSQYANQAEQLLKTNIANYQALPAPRTQSQQTLALQTFDAIWAKLQQLCSDPSMGNAGVRCITDRQQGACHYQQNGACWNWFVGYRDPIENDQVVPDSQASSIASSIGLPAALQSAGISQGLAVPLLIGAGLLLVIMVMQ